MGGLFVASCDPAKLFQLAEAAFEEMSLLVEVFVELTLVLGQAMYQRLAQPAVLRRYPPRRDTRAALFDGGPGSVPAVQAG